MVDFGVVKAPVRDRDLVVSATKRKSAPQRPTPACAEDATVNPTIRAVVGINLRIGMSLQHQLQARILYTCGTDKARSVFRAGHFWHRPLCGCLFG